MGEKIMSKKNTFPKLLYANMMYTGGYIGSNHPLSIYFADTMAKMSISDKRAFIEYKNAYSNTDILKNGYGSNIYKK